MIETGAMAAATVSLPGWTDSYSDRVRPPASTVAALRPHFPRLGITRVADQTGLDRLGIPCFASFRPNSQSLACSQGKGLDADAAIASAVMEAAELAVAEAPDCTVSRTSMAELQARGMRIFDPERHMPFGTVLEPDREIEWVFGAGSDGRSIAVPADLVRMGETEPEIEGLARSTNGLASGNTPEEAVFHGTCELVERDAVTLWSLRAADERVAIDPRSFRDVAVDELCARIGQAGLKLRLFDVTSDLAIPTILAVIGGGPEEERRHFGMTAGYGCHPVAIRAAIRAITESAQSRITLIAGARDDIVPEDFARSLDETHAALLEAVEVVPGPAGLPLGTPFRRLADHLDATLREAGIDRVAVPLGGTAYGIAVVRMLSNGLEDREPNANWRPGPRALSVLLR